MELYDHLMTAQISPELQLMRWLRCALSREFEPDATLQLWDYILGGLYLQHTQYQQKSIINLGTNHRQIFEPFPPLEVDPYVNLDVLCASLIAHIRESLLKSDFSMCLA